MALSDKRQLRSEVLAGADLTLKEGEVAYQGGIACLEISSGKVVAGTAAAGLLFLGHFSKNADASDADVPCHVRFPVEVRATWYANSEDDEVTEVGSLCYIEDDETVSSDSTATSVAGRVWKLDDARGVLVEKLQAVPASPADAGGLELVETDPGAFVANDLVIGDNPVSGSIYEIPATGAASTVTLPATASEGCELTFVADGTNNDETVQYRDATGPTDLTTALTASKRHMVKAVFLNSKWRAIAYVGP